VNTFPPTGPQQLGRLLNVAWQGAGGTAPYNYTLISGLLPTGAYFTNSDCFCLVLESIQGAPTSSGTFDLVVGVTDSKQRTATANLSFTVALYTPPSFASISSIDAFIGQEIDVTYIAIGGQAPLLVSLAPGNTLPPGLTLSSSGRLRGARWATAMISPSTSAAVRSRLPRRNSRRKATTGSVSGLLVSSWVTIVAAGVALRVDRW